MCEARDGVRDARGMSVLERWSGRWHFLIDIAVVERAERYAKKITFEFVLAKAVYDFGTQNVQNYARLLMAGFLPMGGND